MAQYPGHIQFICSISYDWYEEVISCNNITNNIVHQGGNYFLWKLKPIIAYERPLIQSHPNYGWSWYDVMVELETWDNTINPLSFIARYGTITCALYIGKNNLFLTVPYDLILRYISVTLHYRFIKSIFFEYDNGVPILNGYYTTVTYLTNGDVIAYLIEFFIIITSNNPCWEPHKG